MNKLNVFLAFIAVCSFYCCKSDKKKVEVKKDKVVFDTKIKKFNFPKIENLLVDSQLYNLSDKGHMFEEGIVFEEVNVLKTGVDTYTFVFVFDKDLTNFDKLKKWKIGAYLFAKNPNKFIDEKHRKSGYKTLASLTNPKLMGDEVVAVLENYKISPKELKLFRVYLYGYEGEINNNYYNISSVTLP